MTNSDIKDCFDRFFGGQKNFMTPKVIAYFKCGNYIGEFSVGRDISGLTILSIENNTIVATEGLSGSLPKGTTTKQARDIFRTKVK